MVVAQKSLHGLALGDTAKEGAHDALDVNPLEHVGTQAIQRRIACFRETWGRIRCEFGETKSLLKKISKCTVPICHPILPVESKMQYFNECSTKTKP